MVEPPGGNSIRWLLPKLDVADGLAAEASVAHQYFSANKRSVVLDLDHRRDDFLSLVATADVVIDTERPGHLAALGLSHGELRAVRPDLVQCSITPFGLTGEWRDRTATDLVAGAAGGLVWLSGEPRNPPVQGGADVAYAMAGLSAASGIAIALHAVAGSPSAGGVHLDVSLQEAAAMATMQTATPSQWTWFGRIPRRPGLSAALRCADGGHVSHLVRPDRFTEFLAWCDREGVDHGMVPDDWPLSRMDQIRDSNPVMIATAALAAKLTRDEFVAGAHETDIVCLPMLTFDDFESTEQFTSNDQFPTVRHDLLDLDLGFVRSPVDGIGAPVPIRRAPALGGDQALLDDLVPLPTTSPGRVPTPSTLHPSTALAGLRVIDFGWVLAAPIGTRILASYGAEVIRVESSAKPDSMRSQIGPDNEPDLELGGLFQVVNAGKKSFAVDLRTPAGMALVSELIATADVVVNNFRPGAMDRMGLGFDVLQTLNPDVVSLNLPGAHLEGPWSHRPSMGPILMAASGFNMITGFEDDPPRGIGLAYPDFTGPHLLATAVLAAIRHRDRSSGESGGREITLPQLSAMVSLLGAEWMHYKASGVHPPRRANRDPNLCPHGVYPALASDDRADEWLALAVADDDGWEAFCSAIGRPDLSTDPRLADLPGRKAHEDEIDAAVSAWSATVDKWEAAEMLQGVGVAAAPVEDLADTHDRDPQLRYRYQVVNHPLRPDVDIPVDREVAHWVGSPLSLTRAPMLGEHNEYVVQELLGRSDEEFVGLIADGTLG